MSQHQLIYSLLGLCGFLAILACIDFRYLFRTRRRYKTKKTPVPSPFRERAPRVELKQEIEFESLGIVQEEDHGRGTQERDEDRSTRDWLRQEQPIPFALHRRAATRR